MRQDPPTDSVGLLPDKRLSFHSLVLACAGYIRHRDTMIQNWSVFKIQFFQPLTNVTSTGLLDSDAHNEADFSRGCLARF